MVLHFRTQPADGIARVKAELGRFSMPSEGLAADDNLRDAANAPDAADATRVDRFHPVYVLPAGAVFGERPLESAERRGYCYLVKEGSTLSAAFTGDNHDVVMRSYGPYAEGVARALAEVEKISDVAAGSYEVRVLRCPAIFLSALWLKPDRGEHDILYPLAPAPDGIRAEHAYPPDEFARTVRSLIEKRVAQSKPG
jgi:hypothetical protein